MSTTLFDGRSATLGEGAFWHPERQQAFWFDILNQRLLSRDGDAPLVWQFEEYVSAAGWIDHDHLLIASATALFSFDLRSGVRRDLVALEAEIAGNRSNDGRADPQGGFWIGTMALDESQGAGAIYRYYGGELRRIVPDVSIPNAIAFAPDGSLAYYADTAQQKTWRQPLDPEGWPEGEAQLFLDLGPERLYPDGAVTDAAGNLWCALWGAGRLICHAPGGERLHDIALPAKQPTCPAFIGAALDRILVTSAAIGLDGVDEGKTWEVTHPSLRGLPAPRIRIET